MRGTSTTSMVHSTKELRGTSSVPRTGITLLQGLDTRRLFLYRLGVFGI